MSAYLDRSYGIDLLKMVSMIGVVVLHVIVWGGAGEAASLRGGLVGWSVLLLKAIFVPAVNCFILATGFVMRDKVFRASRLLNLWAQVFFYSVFISCFGLFSPEVEFTLKRVVKIVLPITFNQYWFVTKYFGLCLLMPILNVALKTLNERQVLLMILGGGVVFSLYPTMTQQDPFGLEAGFSVLWFAYLYFVGGAYSLYQDRVCVSKTIVGIVFCLCVLLSLILPQTLHSYVSPTTLLSAVCACIFFAQVSFKSSLTIRALTFVAPGVFSVYLIHSNKIFREFTHWNGRFADLCSDELAILRILGIGIMVFVICVVVDSLRQNAVRLCKRMLHGM